MFATSPDMTYNVFGGTLNIAQLNSPQSVEAPSGERLRGKRQVWCLLQVKLCDPCLSTLKWFIYHARHYTSARLYI